MSRITVALLTAAALVIPSPGAATTPDRSATADAERAPTWGPVKTLARNPWGADLAVDGQGRVLAVWSTASSPHQVWFAGRGAAGGWSAPKLLGRGVEPAVSANARGDATVVWKSQRVGFVDGVLATTRLAGGSWSAPVQLTRPLAAPGYVPGVEGNYGADAMTVALNPSGFTVATWAWGSDYLDQPYRIRAATRQRVGAWSSPVVITRANGSHRPQVVASPGRRAVVTYQTSTAQGSWLRARRLAHGRWSTAEPVVRAGLALVGADRFGIITVAYTQGGAGLRIVTAPPDGPWSTPTLVATGPGSLESFTLDVNARGAAIVTTLRDTGEVALARRTTSGRWLPPVQLSAPAGSVYAVTAGLNAAGDTFVGWGGYAVYGRYRPAGAAWGPRLTVSPDSGVEVLEAVWSEVLPNGDVAMMWDQEARPLKVRILTAHLGGARTP